MWQGHSGARLADEPELGSRCQAEVSAAIPPCLKTHGETGWVVCSLGTQWHQQSLTVLTFCAVRESSVIVFSSTKWDDRPMAKLS